MNLSFLFTTNQPTQKEAHNQTFAQAKQKEGKSGRERVTC
jgi:hypothetical protein